jgi:MFS family permease
VWGVLRSLTRNRSVLCVVLAYAIFTVAEYSVWVAMLVYAYAHGGATTAGVVAVLQLAPAAVVGPLAAVSADRSSPLMLFLVGCGAQAAGMALAAVAIVAGWPPAVAYAGAIVASAWVSAIRPAQAALLPTLATTADELTGANVALAAIEAVGVSVAGLLTAVLLTRGPGAVFAAGVVLIGFAAVAVAWIPIVHRPALSDEKPASAWSDVLDGVKALSEAAGARVLVGLLTMQDVVLGALDVLFVVLAIQVLHRSQSWTGYLNSAVGIGGVLAGVFTALLIGRRLPLPILVSSVVFGVGLGLCGFTDNAVLVVASLVLVGASRSVLNLATRTLLQRSVPAEVLGRVFGLVEGGTMAGLAVGSIAAAGLIALGGPRLALIAVGAALPVCALLSARWLLALDRETRVPVVEISLLRSIPMFALLPPPSLEASARALRLRRLVAGERLITEGDVGEDYFAVASGDLEISLRGRVLRHCGRGSGVGEIALLRSVPRTATATATAESVVYALDRDSFLVAITGHAPSRTSAAIAVDTVLSEDERV